MHMESYLLMVAANNNFNFIMGYHLTMCLWSADAPNSHLSGAQDNLICAPNSFILKSDLYETWYDVGGGIKEAQNKLGLICARMRMQCA